MSQRESYVGGVSAGSKIESEARSGLAARFYNDAYWFDQMACSSRRMVVWLGTPGACAPAQDRFWPAVEREIEKRGVSYGEMVGLNKLVSAYVSAATGVADRILPGVTGTVSRIRLAEDAEGEFQFRCHQLLVIGYHYTFPHGP